MNPNDNIILSIIIPVYKVEKYIDECLSSIFSCKSIFYEVIIINDGTPDNSMDTVFRYKKLYPQKIRIIEQENKGLSITRNNGIKIAKGKYIWCVDSDDYLEENAIQYIINVIMNSNNTDVIAMPLNHCFIDGTKQYDIIIDDKLNLSCIEYLNKKLPFGASQRYIINKNVLDSHNLKFIPNKLHEDGDFGLRLLYFSTRIIVIKKSLYNYRIRESGSIMSSWKTKNSQDLIDIYDGLYSLLSENPLKINVTPFFDALLQLLNASILFARSKWNTNEFRSFYKANKKGLIKRALQIQSKCSKNLKKKIKLTLFVTSPLICCKILSFKK